MTIEPKEPTRYEYLEALVRIPILQRELKRLRTLVATFERREEERAEEVMADMKAAYEEYMESIRKRRNDGA